MAPSSPDPPSPSPPSSEAGDVASANADEGLRIETGEFEGDLPPSDSDGDFEDEVTDRAPSEPARPPYTGRIGETVDSWRNSMYEVAQLQEILAESELHDAVDRARAAEDALREVLAIVEARVSTGRVFYDPPTTEDPSRHDNDNDNNNESDNDEDREQDQARCSRERGHNPDFDSTAHLLACDILDRADDTRFLCPIGLVAMRDPCVAADGITYDRKNIQCAIRARPVSPMTRKFLYPHNVYPNVLVRTLMFEGALQHASHEEKIELLRL